MRVLDLGGALAPADPEPVPTTEPVAVTITGESVCTVQPAPALGSDDDTIPGPVVTTQMAIVDAAFACDYDTLASLTGQDFWMGFNVPEGTDPMAEWSRNEAAGRSLAEIYRDVLLHEGAQRIATDGTQLWQWPAVGAYDTIEDIPADTLDRFLARSGMTLEDFEADWDLFGAYSGYVLTINTDGTWDGAAPAD